MAGGELLIPALVLVFGADIKTAGSASILISLGVVSIGLWRYWQADAISRGLRREDGDRVALCFSGSPGPT